jgi:hypothetical protein
MFEAAFTDAVCIMAIGFGILLFGGLAGKFITRRNEYHDNDQMRKGGNF